MMPMVRRGMNGVEFLEMAKAPQPDIEIVMMTGNGSVRTAVQAMHPPRGAGCRFGCRGRGSAADRLMPYT